MASPGESMRVRRSSASYVYPVRQDYRIHIPAEMTDRTGRPVTEERDVELRELVAEQVRQSLAERHLPLEPLQVVRLDVPDAPSPEGFDLVFLFCPADEVAVDWVYGVKFAPAERGVGGIAGIRNRCPGHAA